MEFPTAYLENVDLIWDRIVSDARFMISRPNTQRSLIVESLTSAHREISGDYASNGNREISSTGQIALGACIKRSKRNIQSEGQTCQWNKLRVQKHLLQIVNNSPLKHCIVPSIRQNGYFHQEPLTQRVASYAVQGLIGAVYLDANRNLDEVSTTLSALCRYLDPEISANANEISPPPTISSAEQDTSASGQAADDTFMDWLASDEQEWGRFALEANDFPMHDWLSETPAADLNDSEFLLALQNVSLSHTSLEGKQTFVQTNTQPVGRIPENAAKRPPERPSEDVVAEPTSERLPQGSEDSRVSASRPRSSAQRPVAARKIESYLQRQRQLADSLTTTSGVQAPPTLSEVTMPYKGQKHALTMDKIYHGCVSPPLVIRIKMAIEARRSEIMLESRTSPEGQSALYHYQKVDSLLESAAQNTVHNGQQVNYHTYMCYLKLRERFRMALDDGFIHSDQSKVNGPGNPILKSLSIGYNTMLRQVAPNLEYLHPDEQKRVRRIFDRRRLLGIRFHRFVRDLGIGSLLLLLFKAPGCIESVFDMSEAEFIALTEIELDALIKLMLRPNLPYVEFARAAEKVLVYLVNGDSFNHGRFCCEETNSADIDAMVEGSSSLLAQFDLI